MACPQPGKTACARSIEELNFTSEPFGSTARWTPVPHAPLPMKADLVEKASAIVTNPQILINAVSKRVRQLTMGRPAMVLPVLGERHGLADIALLEIIEGKLKVEAED